MKKIIPYGDRILVKRHTVGEKLGKEGLIIATGETSDRPTDIADVVFVPEHTFADKDLIEQSDHIISALVLKAASGESDALVSLLRFNDYLKIKGIKAGDEVMISKYVGVDFYPKESAEMLTLVNAEDIIGIVKQK